MNICVSAFLALAYQPRFDAIFRCTKDFKELPINVHLHKELNDPTNIYNPGSIDRIMMGLVAKSVTKTDEFLAQEVTNHLFQVLYYFSLKNLHFIIITN